jgi:hypothetical protein
MDIPGWQYWITPDAIWPVGSFALALWLGFFEVKDSMSKAHRIVLAAMFGVLSLFGWYSIARQTESSEINSKNIGKIASALNVKPGASIDAVVDKLVARIKATTDTPTVAPDRSRQQYPPNPTASVSVTRQEVFDVTGETASTRLWYKRVGEGTAYAPAAFSLVRITDNSLSAGEQKEIMSNLRTLSLQHPPPRNSEISSDQEYFLPLVKVAAADWQAVQQSKKHMYIFSVITNRDKSLISGWWVDEYISDTFDGNTELNQRSHPHVSKHQPPP